MEYGNPFFWKMNEEEYWVCWVGRRSIPPSQEIISWISFMETYVGGCEFGNILLVKNYIGGILECLVYPRTQTIDLPLNTVDAGCSYIVRKCTDLGEILWENPLKALSTEQGVCHLVCSEALLFLTGSHQWHKSISNTNAHYI